VFAAFGGELSQICYRFHDWRSPVLRNSLGWLFGLKSRSMLSKPCVRKDSVFKNRYRPSVEALEDRLVPTTHT
jgi:hypothetical protein